MVPWRMGTLSADACEVGTRRIAVMVFSFLQPWLRKWNAEDGLVSETA